ncbi:MAG: Lrp/AsnC ligand binding domain-containing protein [Bacteroidales bacterium]|jgi:Lrp/AsnC family transcriptional regulator for asnA, asnC and gidA|nr:Lrp/AsnC ligand binding domain-containing protein [Bacteroidales bacterium]NLM93678.1 AsnC family transcriptional regulator [Bacteroidales bacterium]
MEKGFQIDSTDKKILEILSANARMPFLEVARMVGISGAAVHQRVQKLMDAGILDGSRFCLNPKGLGYYTCAFIGIQVNLLSTSTHEQVFQAIKKIPEIVECHHISGKYSLFLKVFTKNNEHLKKIIVEKIQTIPEVTATETFISLEEGFVRQLPIREGNVFFFD